MQLLVELSRDIPRRHERTTYSFNRPTESSSRKRLLRWVVPLCATGQSKVDFKRPAGHKEAQKFTFACCSRVRGKNATVHQLFRKVPVATTESSSLRNSPGISSFSARFVFTSTYRLCAGCTNDGAVQHGEREMSLRSRYRETRLIILTDAAVVSLRGYHYFSKWTSYLPLLARLPAPQAILFTHLSVLRAEATCGSSLFVLLQPQRATNMIFPSVRFTRTKLTSS